MTQTEKTRMYDRISKHGEDLKAIFGLSNDTDAVKLCKQLRKIEMRNVKILIKMIRRNKMSSELARHKAARAWCTPETSDIEMDPRLAEAFAEILDEYIEALQWCSAASDFQKDGQARKGWRKIEYRLLTDEHTPIEGEDGYDEYVENATEKAEEINKEFENGDARGKPTSTDESFLMDEVREKVRKRREIDWKFNRVGLGNWPRFIVVSNIIRANDDDKAEILMINIDEIETIEPKEYIPDGLTHAIIQMTSGSSYSTEETVEKIMNLIQEECISPKLLGA